ncbi:MAG: isoprenyl transferase [Candidatus Methylomirabilia bacterium]
MTVTRDDRLSVRQLAALGGSELLDRVKAGPIPRHVAIIMDGNGRWAVQRGLPRVAGHRQGVRATRQVVRAASKLGIRYLTLYAFSSENWNRPSDEVSTLMSLLKGSIGRELPELMENNVQLLTIGRGERIPLPVRRGIGRAVAATASNTGMKLIMAFSYGGREELVDACRALARQVQHGEIAPEEIDELRIAEALYTHGVPDPDLLVRTSGEMRISNFLLWQLAYTEFWITPTLWPDFGPDELYLAVADYQRRERRFGGV